VISALSVSVIPHLVHPRKAVDLPERIPPQRIGHLGGCIGQVSNPPNSIGTAVWAQVVIKRNNVMHDRRGIAAPFRSAAIPHLSRCDCWANTPLVPQEVSIVVLTTQSRCRREPRLTPRISSMRFRGAAGTIAYAF